MRLYKICTENVFWETALKRSLERPKSDGKAGCDRTGSVVCPVAGFRLSQKKKKNSMV
jgi:hypothetical protein